MGLEGMMLILLLSITLIRNTCVVAKEDNSTTSSNKFLEDGTKKTNPYVVAKDDNSTTSSNKFLKDGTKKTNPYKRHGVKSIRSGDGDIIDCIDMYKQPAFDHPALRNHTIQMRPNNGPRMEKGSRETETSWEEMKKEYGNTISSQLWQRSGSCPKGTIPVRRMPNKALLNKANATHAYGRKNATMQSNDYIPKHSVAGLITEGYSYSGGKANIKVWNPYVETEDEYSTSQVSLLNGDESIQSGWAVNPSVYKDHQTRYFVYWTVDASKKTGCFDLTCPGFVQVNHEIALGAAIYPISNPTGLPYEIIVYIHKDPVTGNWWVQFGESTTIGYWPAELFKLLRYHAVIVQWGGEVYSSRVKTHPHTATNMGSGKWPDWIFQDSGMITRMRIEENSHELKFPEWVNAHSDEYECYDVFYVSDYMDDPQFFYGGPGRNERCP